jgi:hypothetical protein
VLGQSRLTILADGVSMAPVNDRFEHGGRFIELKHYIRHDTHADHAVFQIDYRPSDAIKTPYTLCFSVPETKNTAADDPTVSGP